MDAYIEDRRVEGKKVEKMKLQWNNLKPTFSHLQPGDVATKMKVEGERRTLCHKYALERSDAGRARDTIQSELALLRTGLNWGERHNLIVKAPYVWVPPPGKGRDTALTDDEMRNLIAALAELQWHVRLTILIAMVTGARKEAILELEWSRVNFENRTIDFNRGEERSILDTSHEKGRAVVDMTGALYDALLEAWEWKTPGCPNVIEYRGKPVGDVKKAIRHAFLRAGIYRRFMGLHALRHTLATWAAAAGIQPERIQRILGHADIKTTIGTYIGHKVGSLTEVAGVVSDFLKADDLKNFGSKRRGDSQVAAPSEGQNPQLRILKK